MPNRNSYIHSPKDVYRTIYSSVVHKVKRKGKLPKCPSEIKWVSKFTVEYYTAGRISELQHITTQMNFSNVILKKGNQAQRNPYYMIPFIYEMLCNDYAEQISGIKSLDNGYFGGIVTGRSHVGISGFW